MGVAGDVGVWLLHGVLGVHADAFMWLIRAGSEASWRAGCFLGFLHVAWDTVEDVFSQNYLFLAGNFGDFSPPPSQPMYHYHA